MHRHARAAIALIATLIVLCLAPMLGSAPAVAAGECGTHRSETEPPATIRVFRSASGAVETVDFRAYVKNVLSREWISTWTTESLRAGALAVKHYAWYQVLHWRGYLNAAGQCFDVFDSTRDQHYDPSRPTYASMASAVDATWGTLAHRSGHVFATYYNAGAAADPCGANANGWQLLQWGTQACGLAGRSASEIMGIYYAGVTVIAPPATAPVASPAPAPTPPPAPTASPAPSPTPAPGSGSPPPVASPPPPTLPPPSSTPAPPPSPEADAASPGGGQVGLTVPPPPPPPNPAPVVVSVATIDAVVAVLATAEARAARSTEVDIGRLRDHAVVRFEADVDADARRAVTRRPAPRFATQLLVIQLVLDRAVVSVPIRLGG
jgi:hypothetical protein